MKSWWVSQNCKVTAGNILFIFLDFPYVSADQACACASFKVRLHKAESPGTFLPVNFLGDRGLVFLLFPLFACCSSGQDDWCGRHVPLSTLRNALTSSPWAQMSPLIFLMPVTLPLLLLVFQRCCRCRSASWSLGGQREPHTSLPSPLLSAAQHRKVRVKGWSSGSSGSALAAPCAGLTPHSAD